MVTPGAELLDRSFLQMKIADLPGGTPEAAATTDASTAPAADPAAVADPPTEATADPVPAAPGGEGA
jgi:hypothetical protein